MKTLAGLIQRQGGSYLDMISDYVPPVDARAFTFTWCSWGSVAPNEWLLFAPAMRTPTGGTPVFGQVTEFSFVTSAGPQEIFAVANDWFDLTAGQSYDFGIKFGSDNSGFGSPSGTGVCSIMVQVFSR